MLRLLVDTCVWLDLAKDLQGQKLLVTVRLLVHSGELQILVPQLVLDEFDRNQARIETDMVRSTTAQLRAARAAIEEHGRDHGRQHALDELDNVAHREPLIKQMAVRNFAEIREILDQGQRISPTDQDHANVVGRALSKNAPFHRSKNSVADALLIEMYGSVLNNETTDPADRYAFITHNTKDFSSVEGDFRHHHPDFGTFFSRPNSGYFISLATTLASHFPAEFNELLEENDFREEPRDLEEIHAAERRLFDMIWYQRSISRMDSIGTDARARIEEQYQADGLGPHTDFEWGMLNGKLSALRWILGSEWDFLDT